MLKPDSPAAKANIQTGDVILRFGNKENPKWEDIDVKTLLSANETIPVEIDAQWRDRQDLDCRDRQRLTTRRVTRGGTPFGAAFSAKSSRDFLPSKAGLKPGDEIVGIDGRKVLYFPEFRSSDPERRRQARDL